MRRSAGLSQRFRPLSESDTPSRPLPFLGRRPSRPVSARCRILAAAGPPATVCFGKFALGVTQTVEPNPILPGASVKQEVNVEADGLLGSAVKQAMTDAAAKSPAQGQSGTQWQIRDTSQGAQVHLRMSRSVSLAEAQTAVSKTSTGGFDAGTVSAHADDWGLARHYAGRVGVSPSAPASPRGTTPGAYPTSPQI